MNEKLPNNNNTASAEVRSPQLSDELAAARNDFPDGRPVIVTRNVYDSSGNPTGTTKLEDGWVVARVGVRTRQGVEEPAVVVTVPGHQDKIHKVYHPDELRKHNSSIPENEISEFSPEALGVDRAMGGTAVAHVLSEVPTSQVEAAPSRLLPPPELASVVGVGGQLPSGSEKSSQATSVEAVEVADEVDLKKIKKFLGDTESTYDKFIVALKSNFSNGIETETIREVQKLLREYIEQMGLAFGASGTSEDKFKNYSMSRRLIGSSGEIGYQLDLMAEPEREGTSGFFLGNIIEVLQKSRSEMEEGAKQLK
ncbi:MAG: hypothetical protein WBP12_05135 [Candidatus Saccharimonas sp.]